MLIKRIINNFQRRKSEREVKVVKKRKDGIMPKQTELIYLTTMDLTKDLKFPHLFPIQSVDETQMERVINGQTHQYMKVMTVIW